MTKAKKKRNLCVWRTRSMRTNCIEFAFSYEWGSRRRRRHGQHTCHCNYVPSLTIRQTSHKMTWKKKYISVCELCLRTKNDSRSKMQIQFACKSTVTDHFVCLDCLAIRFWMKANFMRIAHKHTNAIAFDKCLILRIRELMGGKQARNK